MKKSVFIGIVVGVIVIAVITGFFMFSRGDERSIESEEQDANVQEGEVDYFINELGMYELPFSLFQDCMDENPDSSVLQGRCIIRELDEIRESDEETSDKCFYTCREWKECAPSGLQGRGCIYSNCGYLSIEFSKSGGLQRECQYEGDYKPGTSEGITEDCGDLGQQCCIPKGAYYSIITEYYCDTGLVCNDTHTGSCVECGEVGEECCIMESNDKSYYQCDNDMTCTKTGCFDCGKEGQDACEENVYIGINVLTGTCREGLIFSKGKCILKEDSSSGSATTGECQPILGGCSSLEFMDCGQQDGCTIDNFEDKNCIGTPRCSVWPQDMCGVNGHTPGCNWVGPDEVDDEEPDPCEGVPDDEYYQCFLDNVKDMSCTDDLDGFICDSSQTCLAETFPTADTDECCLMGCS